MKLGLATLEPLAESVPLWKTALTARAAIRTAVGDEFARARARRRLAKIREDMAAREALVKAARELRATR